MAKSFSPKLKLATTSSIHDSGLLTALIAAFYRLGGVGADVRVVGTGMALRMGRCGEVDAVVVHNTTSELQFLEAGHGVNRREFMTNDFLLVGPRKDPAGAAGEESVFDALACISRNRALFLSRGDDSGTNMREIELWAASAALPFGQPWYRLAEGGMISCLNAASDEGAYTLTDAGSFLAQARRLALRVICADPRHLRNAYSVITVNPARYPHVRHDHAEAFAAFLTGGQGQGIIANFRSGGQALFHPLQSITPQSATPQPTPRGGMALERPPKRVKGGRRDRLR